MAHRLSPEAAAELEAIWLYIAEESGSIMRADRVVDAITRRFQALASHPRIGRQRNDLRPGLRGFPVDEYLILYRIENEEVLIPTFLTGAAISQPSSNPSSCRQ